MNNGLTIRFLQLLICVALLLLLLAASAWAGGAIFYFIDENGAYHFADYRKDERYRPFQVDTPRKKAPKVKRRSSIRSVSPEQKAIIVSLIEELSETWGMDASLVKAVVRAESNFDTMALSKKNARGLMQLLPSTARDYGVHDPWDPTDNLTAGIRHLRGLLIKFDGDLSLTLAAYNAGLTQVVRYGGVPPFSETKNYVNKVTRYYLAYRREAGARGDAQ